MYFCIRDDDTSYFTSPNELERAYSDITKHGPVSLAIIPFCRAGRSRGLPAAARERWSVHPLHENEALVRYLRQGIADGRFEAMLHGYHHDEPDVRWEFVEGSDLADKVKKGKQYLEDVLHAATPATLLGEVLASPTGVRSHRNHSCCGASSRPRY